MGYSDGELLHRDALEIVYPDDLDEIRRIFDAVANPGPTKAIWVRIAHADGSWRWFEAIANNLLDEPAVGGIVVHARDITEQHDAAYACGAANGGTRHRRGPNRADCRYQADTTLTFVNEAYRETATGPSQSFSGPGSSTRSRGRTASFTLRMIGSLTSENPVATHAHRVIRPTGRSAGTSGLNCVVLDDEGGIAEYQAVGRDITDQRLAEEAAVKSGALANEQARVLQLITDERAAGRDTPGDVSRGSRAARRRGSMLDPVAQRGRHHGAPPFRHHSALALLVEADRCPRSTGEPSAPSRSLISAPASPTPSTGRSSTCSRTSPPSPSSARGTSRRSYQAQHDPLTGLPNRPLFLELLQLALARSRRRDDTSPCCSSTSTGSRWSTTASATTPATGSHRDRAGARA